MKIEEVIHEVESRLFNLGRKLIQADTASDVAEELELVRAELARREGQRDIVLAELSQRRQRLESNQSEAALLPSRIADSMARDKSAQAMRQALELEGLRRQITQDTAEVPRLEQILWSLEFSLRRLRRRWNELSDLPRRNRP